LRFRGPQIAALAGAFVSVIALGVAVGQIMPPDRARLPSDLRPAIVPPSSAPVRNVTPMAAEPPRDLPPVVTEQPSGASMAAAPPRAPLPVPAPASARPAAAPVELLETNTGLPAPVMRMRERLIEAARSGQIDRLKIAFETNETMPVFTRNAERDPAAFWRQASGDGEGLEVLAILANIMDMPPARRGRGTPQEMYVWPYLADVPLDRLTPTQSVDLYRLMTAQDVRDMRVLNAWVFWRVGIGRDGTLHFFLAGE
jgi:hypothetical protein